MNQSSSDQRITEFVRRVLGCGCPDKVFEKIEVSSIQASDLPFGISRINIGNTLLIFIARPASSEHLQSALYKLVVMGREDRDSHGFNRFRFVVAGSENELEFDLVSRRFEEYVRGDEKMHIHFVHAKDVDSLPSHNTSLQPTSGRDEAFLG
jgi:hypothetical protein